MQNFFSYIAVRILFSSYRCFRASRIDCFGPRKFHAPTCLRARHVPLNIVFLVNIRGGPYALHHYPMPHCVPLSYVDNQSSRQIKYTYLSKLLREKRVVFLGFCS